MRSRVGGLRAESQEPGALLQNQQPLLLSAFMRRLAIILIALFATPLLAATRLPQTVIPSHYAIRIAPDLANETFSGSETIDVDITEPVDSITLHSVDLTLGDVFVERSFQTPSSGGGQSMRPTVTADVPNETVTFKLGQTLPPGPATIRIDFNGKLTKQLRGLYLSTTAKRKYAVTQFESTSARRAFPCFDEPAMKATFDITLVVDNGDTAISNGAIVSDTPEANGKHAIKFATSKRMSTYLVAMLVGDFQCISGAAGNVPIRVCSTPGLQQLGGFALQAAQASVSFFEQYYGIPYPFGKLDLIGIPDFAAGAMENAGAITFRETDLLSDPKTASVLQQKRVAEVVAHEIAHQWFGDLVTMKWWNDIWLNEGFATFMSEKPIEAWKPEWREDLDKPVATDEALSIDSTLSTQPIRTPSSGESGFGNAGIIYGKTASVLRMVEQWIGPDQFRDAIRTYLKKYSWSNAAAEDFWATMKASTNQPTDVVLASFIDLTGVPLLHVSDTSSGNTRQVTISQERLLPTNQTAPAAQVWTIPICADIVGLKEIAQAPCRIVTKSPETLTYTVAPSQALFLSRIGSGYFAVDYSPAEREAIRVRLGDLVSQDRISFNGNEWLLVRTAHLDVAEYLRLLRSMPRPAERPLVTTIADNLVYLQQRLVNDGNRAAWQKFVHEALRGYAPFSWDAPAAESSEQRIARASVLWALGYAGDAQVIAGAKKIAVESMRDPSSVDAVIADRALRLSATYGDEAFLNSVLEHLANAPTPELALRYRNLLPLFRDPKAQQRALAYIYSDKVRLQDLPVVAAAGLSDPSTRPAAWAEAKQRWSALEKTAPGAIGRVAGATSSFCDPESRKDVESFLSTHPMRGGQRTATRTLEAIDTCIAFRNAQQASFDKALGTM